MAVYTKINKEDIFSINNQFDIEKIIQFSRVLKKELKIQIIY